jgi:PAS domain S-box-containing protein
MKSSRIGISWALGLGAVLLLAGLVLVAGAAPGAERFAAGALALGANLGFLTWILRRGARMVRTRDEALREAARQQDRLTLATAIVEGTDDAVVSKDLGGVIRSWNHGAERIFGFSAAEAIGRPVSIIVPDDRAAEERQILERIGRGDRVERFETVRRRKDGGLLEVLVTISPVRDSSGTVVGASKIAREVTDRKRIERENVAALGELRDIKAALDEHSIVAITDASGRITYVNAQFCAISKYSRDELIGQDHRIINSGYHPKEFFRDLWATIGRGNVWRGEVRNRAKDGSIYWVQTTIFPRVNSSGKPTQYIAIRTDITQRKADQEEIQRAASELAEKNRELETIVFTASHDLRSPLVNVQGFGRQLERACDKLRAAVGAAEGGLVPKAELAQPLETTIPQALRFINAGVTKIDHLLSGLLRFSRLGRVALNVVPLEMASLMNEIIAAMRFQLNEAKAEIQVDPLPDCLGDSVHTSQVFANLIDNALKYRDPGRPLQITVSGRVRDGLAVYSVADNGIGIAPEHQGKVFEIFHRLNPSAPGGEGLGLTIAQRVLERQRGKIWVESREGSGSTFYVSLPAFERKPTKP